MLAPNKPKGPRACLTCAKAKSRCVPGPVANVCERCQRLGKPCGSQTPAPQRRRRLEGSTGGTDAATAATVSSAVGVASTVAQRPRTTKPTRVSELERRLEVLTSRLETVGRQQKQQQQPTTATSPQDDAGQGDESAAAAAAALSTSHFVKNQPMPYYPMTHIFEPSRQTTTAAADATTAEAEASSPSVSSNNNQSGSVSGLSSSTAVSAPDLDTDDLRPCHFFPPCQLRQPHTPPTGATDTADAAGDVWPQAEEAEMLLQEFRSHLMPLLPFVVVPDGVSSGQLLAAQPLTWRGVMMTACHLDGPRQMLMGNQLLGEATGAALLQPRRSVDVLQALLLLLSWFHYNINSFQLNNLLFLARGITVSLGLGEPHPPSSSPDVPDGYTSEVLQKMRCFSGTFYLATVATTNKKADTMMNSPYLDTCCQVLERRMEQPSDRFLVQLVRIQQLSQAIVVAFSLRNAGIQMDLSTSFMVENLSQRIAQYKAQLPVHFRNDVSINCHMHLAEVLLYEVGLQDSNGLNNGLSLPVAERLNLLSACMRATRDYMQSRFAEPVQDQPRFVCLTAFDFIYAFLTALKLMTFQMPGWDPRLAREELAFDYVVSRQIFDMQQLARRRGMRSHKARGSEAGAAAGRKAGSSERRDPFQRLATRLVELKAMISRELDQLPSKSTGEVAMSANEEMLSAVAEAAKAPTPTPAPAPVPVAESTNAAMADAELMTDLAGDFDIGMIDAAPAIFSFADATMDYMQNMDGSSWPDLFNTPGLDSYMDVNLGTPPFDWDITPLLKKHTITPSSSPPFSIMAVQVRPVVDYSVYLVTDGTAAILGDGRTVEGVVQAALTSRQASEGSQSRESSRSSVGIVQLRDKQSDARGLLASLAALHEHTAAAVVPLVINDRVDVAAAAMTGGFCEGVHLGQDDVDVATARRLLGPAALIGVTASTAAEAVAACRDGADYLGLGTVFATATKTDTKHVVGTAGLRRMLAAIARAGFGHVPAVCIGGIGAANARRVVFQGAWEGDDVQQLPPKRVDGIAVVSAIMSAPDPAAAADQLARQVRLGQTCGPTAFWAAPTTTTTRSKTTTRSIQPILAAMHRLTPLSHNMTNLVVQNLAANVALAVGASPIMANSGAEAADLARLPASALLVNTGSVTPESVAAYVQAIAAYNAAGRPIVYDPVGAGATDVRRAAVRTVMAAGYIDVIKGNEGEMQAVYAAGSNPDDGDCPDSSSAQQQRGVDGSSRLDGTARARLVRRLAARERCVVVLTGPVDYVAEPTGCHVLAVAHGHPLLGQVTGTGCTLGTAISAAVAAAGVLREEATDPSAASVFSTFHAVVAALVLYERAAELAAQSATVAGPGSFVPAFLDCLASCRHRAAAGDMAWVQDNYRITDTNPPFASYCPYCQIASAASPAQHLLPPGLKPPPPYRPGRAPASSDAPPPYTAVPLTKQTIVDDTPILHHLDHDRDSIASLSLRYNVPADVLRRTNRLAVDHLLLGRRVVEIPRLSSSSSPVSLSPNPVEGEVEALRKSQIRRFMVACKVADYDLAVLYLDQAAYDLAPAIAAYQADELWERQNPQVRNKIKTKTKTYNRTSLLSLVRPRPPPETDKH
ncbi:thiamine biosynthetic bifunctional enzyme [Grosmannia clavigera kw1407]|uniref:Thiamine biosynthetic bifunctional enzyme n=1 Tax=Grosmannia clavigera (strain kw1407 / UAMH 11150) TaxID=655863 RepID=F0XPT8_GROCL|nr:thiamine biosynthetic bifunctional enzyme [Grosmannia clavigera kw1407]EFX00747.1 thiamine biosynthetic bifunctional enzyme [Grosmannia clavigera kw1407]